MLVRESYVPCLTISYHRPLLKVVCEIVNCFNDRGLFFGIPSRHLRGGTEKNMEDVTMWFRVQVRTRGIWSGGAYQCTATESPHVAVCLSSRVWCGSIHGVCQIQGAYKVSTLKYPDLGDALKQAVFQVLRVSCVLQEFRLLWYITGHRWAQ
jgi:hypothetical protein